MMKRVAIFVATMAGFALGALAQSDTALRFNPTPIPNVVGADKLLKPQFSIITPNIVAPSLSNYLAPEPLQFDNKLSLLPDSLKATPELSVTPQVYRPENRYNFRGNPFSRDWSAGGELMRIDDNLSLVGSGSYTTYPALGNIGTGSLGLYATPTDRLSIGLGANAVKYHMGRSAWNDYGLYVNGSFKLTDRLSVNAFGQYYFDKRYHSVGAMGYMQSAVYGGSFDYKFSDKFSLALGAQRYYDPYTRTWKTVPIVAPTITLFGSPMTVDVGGILYNLVEAIIYNARENKNNYSLPAGAVSAPTGPMPMNQFNSRRAQGGNIR